MKYAGTAFLVTVTDGAAFGRVRAQFVHLGPRDVAERAGESVMKAVRLSGYGRDREAGFSPAMAMQFLDAIEVRVVEIDLHQA